jgi:hypothetical protein
MNEFEMFNELKRGIRKTMSEQEFNDLVSGIEFKLTATFPNISSSLLHQSVVAWITLQAQYKKDKVSFMALSKDPVPRLQCISCDSYPLYLASYIDKKNPRALVYFACNEHYLGSIPPSEKEVRGHNLMKDVEDLADQFYEMRKEMGMID